MARYLVSLAMFAAIARPADAQARRRAAAGGGALQCRNARRHPEPKALSIPLFLADEAEAECVFERVRPPLEGALERRGFAAVHWSRLEALPFCTGPHRTAADMRRRGLSVVAVEPLPWRNAMGEAQRVLRGDVVPAAFLDGLAAARAACRPAPD